MVHEAIKYLIDNETPYNRIQSFSSEPGIYAIFFIGDTFPIYHDEVSKHQLIYIGKTESSQASRDEKTHFADGKTGSSTLRKSLGALLRESKQLNPIPRNDTDYSKKKYSHYKFDEISESVLTKWMRDNLAISFFEFKKGAKELDDLETKIIKELVPLLNIDSKNPENIYKDEIKALRKECANLAMKSVGYTRKRGKSVISFNNKNKVEKANSMTIVRSEIIINNLSKADVTSKKIRILVENKVIFPNEKVGTPTTYNLTFVLNNSDYQVSYTIGSHDERSRSGILSLGELLYEKLRIKEGTKLKISKMADGNYSIKRI